ncbi:hypothetical protein [Nitriliruptor alkaliphilus]|nr:hypothetical protein [Nitriliruptor alkaliphilus]
MRDTGQVAATIDRVAAVRSGLWDDLRDAGLVDERAPFSADPPVPDGG